jgi:membrane protease YdiL (CAAX protease family)
MTVTATLLGALLALGSVATAAALRLVAIERSKTLRAGPLAGEALLLVLGAAAEEWLFRVLLLAALTRLVATPVAVVVAAMAFGLPHVIRGTSRDERWANAITSAAFGVVVGSMWIATRNFTAIVGFHAAFNIVSGLLLGAAAIDPLSERLPQLSWPLALRDTSDANVSGLLWRRVLSEIAPLIPLAALVKLFT